MRTETNTSPQSTPYFPSYFTKLAEAINLNSGTMSQSPDVVIKAKFQHYLDYEKNTTEGLLSTWKKLWQVQFKFASWIKAKPEHLFFRHNVTEALNELILGVQLEPGEIVYPDLEYGAIMNICKYKAKREGRPLRVLPLANYLLNSGFITTSDSGTRAVDWILSQLQPNTRLLLVSHVMTLNGLLLPIELLAEEATKRGIFLVVDGAHYIGSKDLDFSKLEMVSAYAGNMHKWMMAPKGTGFGWVHPSWQARISPTHASWTTFEYPWEFLDFGTQSTPRSHELSKPHELSRPSDFAARLLTSNCQDFSSWFALSETLDFWSQHSPEVIFSQMDQLKNFLRSQFEEMGWKCISPLNDSWGPLTAFYPPKKLIEKYSSALTRGIWNDFHIQIATPVTPNREIFVRFSPHIMNDFKEIEKAAEIFKLFTR